MIIFIMQKYMCLLFLPKLENVEFGNYNGLFKSCPHNMDEPLPVEYVHGGIPLGNHEFVVDSVILFLQIILFIYYASI